jgi:electron transfer flavoprotein alpha subunit
MTGRPAQQSGDVFLAAERPVAAAEPARTPAGEEPRLEAGLVAQGDLLARALGVKSRFLALERPESGPLTALAGALVRVIERERPRVLLLADGDDERRLAALVARKLGTTPLFGCRSAVAGEEVVTYRVPTHGGSLEQDFFFAPGRLEVATLDVLTLAASAPSIARTVTTDTITVGPVIPDATPVATIVAAKAAAGSVVQSETAEAGWESLALIAPDFRTVDLVNARRVVAAGMGAAPAELLEQVAQLAELLEASMATTRPMVDEGRLPKDRLVGQTGRTVRPELYLSLGVSGSPHHLAGVQEPGRLLSVDRDPRAPVFQYADQGYLGDLGAVLPGLLRRIEEWRRGRVA